MSLRMLTELEIPARMSALNYSENGAIKLSSDSCLLISTLSFSVKSMWDVKFMSGRWVMQNKTWRQEQLVEVSMGVAG